MTNKCSEDKEPTQNGPNSQPLAASISDTHKRVHKMRGERERGKNRSFFSLRKKELNFTSRAKPYISARFSTGYKSDAKLLLERWKERKRNRWCDGISPFCAPEGILSFLPSPSLPCELAFLCLPCRPAPLSWLIPTFSPRDQQKKRGGQRKKCWKRRKWNSGITIPVHV